MDYAEAFRRAGAPVRNPRNQWSALAPAKSCIAVTIWQHEWNKGCSSRTECLGPAHPRAETYFFNTPENLAEWASNREAAGRQAPHSIPGWNLMKDHHQIAMDNSLPVRLIMVEAEGSADGSSRAEVKNAAFREDLQAVLNYFDPVTGAFEAIWRI